MDNFNWLPLAIIAVVFLAGQGRKLVAGSRQMQATQADRQAQLQAAADQAAAQAAGAAQAAQAAAVRSAAATAGAAVRAAPTPPRPLPLLRTPSVPFQPAAAAPAHAQPMSAGHNFIRGAFADPIHARRAVVLGEILLPPPALR